MLVLSRRNGESLVINGNIVVKTQIIKGRVRLCIKAPADVRILRGELLDKKAA